MGKPVDTTAPNSPPPTRRLTAFRPPPIGGRLLRGVQSGKTCTGAFYAYENGHLVTHIGGHSFSSIGEYIQVQYQGGWVHLGHVEAHNPANDLATVAVTVYVAGPSSPLTPPSFSFS